MKKLLLMMLLGVAIQGMAETTVKGIYETKKVKKYRETSYKFIKEINLNYILPNNKEEIVTYKLENYEISVNKNELLELYNKNKKEPVKDIKNIVSYKDKKIDIKNYIAELVENGRAMIYDKKNKKNITFIVKMEYNNNIYYDEGRGSNYTGYSFYTDKNLNEKVMNFDKITKYGIMIHGSIGNNPYNRELSEKEKENNLKYNNHFEEKKNCIIKQLLILM